jgi:hypothetical protein
MGDEKTDGAERERADQTWSIQVDPPEVHHVDTGHELGFDSAMDRQHYVR